MMYVVILEQINGGACMKSIDESALRNKQGRFLSISRMWVFINKSTKQCDNTVFFGSLQWSGRDHRGSRRVISFSETI